MVQLGSTRRKDYYHRAGHGYIGFIIYRDVNVALVGFPCPTSNTASLTPCVCMWLSGMQVQGHAVTSICLLEGLINRQNDLYSIDLVFYRWSELSWL